MTDGSTGGETVADEPADGADEPADGTEAERTPDGSGDDAPYRGLPGAFVYALRVTDSMLCKSYVVVAALLSLLVGLLVGLGVLTLVVGVGGGSGVFNLSRAFYVLVGLAVVAPVMAPVLLVARRHRRGGGDGPGSGEGRERGDERDGIDGDGSGVRYDRRMALGGYLVVASLYVGLVTTVPPAQQEPVSGALAPVVELLYALPPAAGVVPPLLAVVVVVLVHRTAR